VLPMLRLAREIGHEVTVIDRRADFAISENFPGAHRVLLAKPYQIRAILKTDEHTAAVLMNHHYVTDRDSWIIAPLRAAALAQGRHDLISLWAGQAAPLCRHHKAGELFASLVKETSQLFEGRSRQT
jgi:hypothetical protein